MKFVAISEVTITSELIFDKDNREVKNSFNFNHIFMESFFNTLTIYN